MKCSLGISNFLEEISSLSHSIVFLYFFALIIEEGFLFSPCYSLEFCNIILPIKRSEVLADAMWADLEKEMLERLHIL